MKRVLSILAAAAVAVGGACVTAGPADAATHGAKGRLNLYEDTGYRGHVESRLNYDSTFYNDKYGVRRHSFNDAASSISNRTSSYWKLYRDTNYKGPWVCIAPGDQFSSLKGPFPGISGGSRSDWISSVDKLTASEAYSCQGHTL